MTTQDLSSLASIATGLDIRNVKGRGYCVSIDGTFGLSTAEQEINRKGGRVFAKNKDELIKNTIDEAKKELFEAKEREDDDRIKEIESAIISLKASK